MRAMHRLWCRLFHPIHGDGGLTRPINSMCRCKTCLEEYVVDWHMERRRTERREMQEEAFRELRPAND